MKNDLEKLNNDFKSSLVIELNNNGDLTITKYKFVKAKSLCDFKRELSILKNFEESFKQLFQKEYQKILEKEKNKVYVLLEKGSNFTPNELIENGRSLASILINEESVYLNQIKKPSLGQLFKMIAFFQRQI